MSKHEIQKSFRSMTSFTLCYVYFKMLYIPNIKLITVIKNIKDTLNIN